MQLEQLANIAEIVGMLVVAITFIFLAVQMRQNTKALRSTTAQRANEMAMSIYTPIVENGDITSIPLRGMREPDSLTETETARFYAHWQVSFFSWQNWYYQRQHGGLDDGIWLGFLKLLGDVFHTPGLQRFWHQRRHYFSDGFRDYVDDELRGHEPTPGYRVLGTAESQESSDRPS